MSHDPEGTLRPLRTAEGDVIALRTGQGGAAQVVRLARAAETVLRRMLRDDPTAPVDLRLKALSPDDLPTGALLAELRRRDRLPMQLAAGFHELTTAADRLQTQGGDATPRDAEVAVSVADGLESHVLSQPYEAPLRDPVLAPAEDTLIPSASPADVGSVHEVPPIGRTRPVWPWAAAAGALVLAIVLAIVLTRGRKDGDPVQQGVAAYGQGDTARAVEMFREATRRDPEEPRGHYYLAQIYRQSGRTADAARELSTGLKAAPDDPGLNTELGYLLVAQGRAAQAVDRLKRAVVLDSTSVRAWTGLVLALRASGRAPQGETVLQRAPANVRAQVAARVGPTPVDTVAAPGAYPPTGGTVPAMGAAAAPQYTPIDSVVGPVP